MPDVSVLTPSFGYGRFIRDAIESVLAQTGVTVEHIVQDGGSTDETVSILQAFDDKILWHSEPDKGQSDALNAALAKAQGRWIGWLNADEFYLPGALPTLLYAGEAADADVVFGDTVFTDEHGRFMRLLARHKFSPYVQRRYGVALSSCATIFRRSRLADAPWDLRLRMIMDVDLINQLLASRAHFLYVPRPIGAFRVHANRVTARPRMEFQDEFITVRRKYGLRTGRIAVLSGRLVHGFGKLLSGAITRERKARELENSDLRWFRNSRDHVYERLLEISYKRAEGPPANPTN